MKKFILKLLVFLLPIIFFCFFADNYLSRRLKENHTDPAEYEVWSDIYSANIDAQIAIYGSSRAWVHISSQILEDELGLRVYNFGIDGHNFIMQYLRHKEFQRFNKEPEVILMSVDIFSFQRKEDLYGKEQFLPYMLWNKNIIKYTYDLNGYSFMDYYFPLIRYYGSKKIKNLIFSDTSTLRFRKKGYRGMDRKWNDDLAKAKQVRPKYVIDIDDSIVELFDQFLKECESNNIKVIMVYTPEHVDGQRYVQNRNEVFTVYRNFSKKYNLPFLDFSKNPLCSQKKFFYNSSHLNRVGSEIFSKELSQKLKLILNNN